MSNAQVGVTKLGSNALANNTASGIYNTGLGYYALNANTSGNHNTAMGALSLRLNTTGIHNTATGAYALYSNKTGVSNTANGFDAMYNNDNGHYNSAFGMYSLNKNKTASYNTACGYAASRRVNKPIQIINTVMRKGMQSPTNKLLPTGLKYCMLVVAELRIILYVEL